MVVDMNNKAFILVDSIRDHKGNYDFEVEKVKNALARDSLLGGEAMNWPVSVCKTNPQ